MTFPHKLGRLATRHDERTLHLGRYLNQFAPGTLPPVQPAVAWSKAVTVPWGMMHNDTVGDCTLATAGHMAMTWTANAQGKAKVIPDAAILKGYEDVTAQENGGQGYDPQTGANDNGCVVLDVLNYWRKTGVGGDTIMAYAKVDLAKPDEVRQAIALFGGVYLGVDLPLTAQAQTGPGKFWGVPPTGAKGDGAPGAWGGHAIPSVDYDPHGLTVVTWGALQRMTWNFLKVYGGEAYAIISMDWIRSGKSPGGFPLSLLQQDLHAITGMTDVLHEAA